VKFDWTSEAIETLHRLTAEGYSASIIGEKMGLTKGAVIGKRSRLGIVAHPTITKPAPRRVVKRKPPVVTGKPVAITNLNYFHCKAIIAPKKYCGQIVHRKSFCKDHFKLYYIAQQRVAGKPRLFA
jgi:hypothetical protein